MEQAIAAKTWANVGETRRSQLIEAYKVLVKIAEFELLFECKVMYALKCCKEFAKEKNVESWAHCLISREPEEYVVDKPTFPSCRLCALSVDEKKKWMESWSEAASADGLLHSIENISRTDDGLYSRYHVKDFAAFSNAFHNHNDLCSRLEDDIFFESVVGLFDTFIVGLRGTVDAHPRTLGCSALYFFWCMRA